jgi:hypothetical protein
MGGTSGASAGNGGLASSPGAGLAPSGGGGMAGGEGGRSGGGYPAGGVPPGTYCAEVAAWDPGFAAAESAFLSNLDFARRVGVSCGMQPGDPPPPPGESIGPLMLDPALTCSARLHSKALSEGRDLGVGPEDRMRAAGARFRVASESVDQRPPPSGPSMPPYDPILAIIQEGGPRCYNLLDPRFDSVGIGVYRDFITLDFTGR